MKKEYLFVFIVGLLILSYVLDAVSNPLSLSLATPYHYFNSDTLMLYAFSTTSIVVKAIALFTSFVMLISFIKSSFAKAGTTILVSGLLQLYALQDVATNSQILPLEWALSLTLTGVALIIPAILYLIFGFVKSIHRSLKSSDNGSSENVEEKEL